MKIAKLSIHGFMAVPDEGIEFDVKDFNVIVGRNDVGKSTILRAVNLFFNKTEIPREFLNLSSKKEVISISAVFFPFEEEIIIDDAVPTTLFKEEILNSDDLLEVVKVWSFSEGKEKAKPDYYITRKHYKEDFFEDSETALIKKCKELEIETQKAGSDPKFSNVEKREKIRKFYNDKGADSSYERMKVPSSGKKRAKILWDQIKGHLPRFEYFKADSPLEETGTKIQNYFKAIAEKNLKDSGIDDIEGKIKEELSTKLNNITEKINKVVSESESVKARVNFDWGKVVQVSFDSGEGVMNVPLNQRGDGFRRITMMSYFEHLAEEKGEENIIFGFEEPETYLHPKAQKDLYTKIKELSDSYTTLITTHSPTIVSMSDKSHLAHVSSFPSYDVKQEDVDYSRIVEDLGIKPNDTFYEYLSKETLLLVEGPDDITAFKHLVEKYKEKGLIEKDFEELSIGIIPIGGCDSVQHWVAHRVLEHLQKKYFIVLDSDKNSAEAVSKNFNSLVKLGLEEKNEFHILRKRALENYICPKFLQTKIPGLTAEYDEFTKVKDWVSSLNISELGGKKFARKWFKQQPFEVLEKNFKTERGEDEFLEIYSYLLKKVAS